MKKSNAKKWLNSPFVRQINDKYCSRRCEKATKKDIGAKTH